MPPADERPGNMSPSEYSSTLAPSLLRLQGLRQQPFAPRCGDLYMQWEPNHTAGLKKLQRLVAHLACQPHQRLELENVLNQLHWVSHEGRTQPCEQASSGGGRRPAIFCNAVLLRQQAHSRSQSVADSTAESLGTPCAGAKSLQPAGLWGLAGQCVLLLSLS